MNDWKFTKFVKLKTHENLALYGITYKQCHDLFALHTVVCDHTFSRHSYIISHKLTSVASKDSPSMRQLNGPSLEEGKECDNFYKWVHCLCCYHDISAGDCSKTTSHRPLVNALMHGLQKRWPHAITCTGSFSTFLQAGQVRVSNSVGFRGPFLLYTVVLLTSYPCVFAFVAIL